MAQLEAHKNQEQRDDLGRPATRLNGRAVDQLRPISVSYDQFGYADSSVLFSQGNTKVLVAVSLLDTVPPFLKNKKTGWLTAEYSMLPTATTHRNQREFSGQMRKGRSVEISRLIGRSLRTSFDLSLIGERTIQIDCDVLQADGGTRVAAVTAASLALQKALARWGAEGTIKVCNPQALFTPVVGISVGLVQGNLLLDLSQDEDVRADADFNLVLNKDRAIVELQGTGERRAVTWEQFEQLKKLALSGADQLFGQLG